MKNTFKRILEIVLLLGIAALMSIYTVMCAEYGFQTYPEYGIIFGLIVFFYMGGGLIVVDILLDKLQKERKKNK